MVPSALRALPLASLALTTSLSLAQSSVPSPTDHFGFEVGADGKLADYTQLRSYFGALADGSLRMMVETFGTTSYGQPMIMGVVSSPANLARLEEIRATNRRLALGDDADRADAEALASSHPATVWIDAGMHATEAVAAQNILELAYRMTSRDDDEVRRILEDVVLLIVPANPDGMEMVAKGYMATGRVGSLPVLYQKYIGHDNNRDYYAANQPETRALCRAIYHTWLPQILYNHHQSAPRGTILFTPPFRDPYSHNFDPLVVRGMNIVSAHMNRRFASEGKPGVISRSGAPYSAWWNGGLRTMVPFHNIIGILTEAFGKPDPTPLRPKIDRLVPYGDYPDPVPAQTWHARQTIEYLQTANFAILDYASRYRRELVLDQWRMARNSIERGSRDHWTMTPKLAEIAKARDAAARERGEEASDDGALTDPELRDARVYVLSSDQRNFGAATRLVRSLRYAAIEVHRATRPIEAPNGETYPEGSFFLFADHAFRPHLRDMFEPQWHPDIVGSGGDPVRPYDAAGWTLAMQHDIEFDRILDGMDDRAGLEFVGELDVPFRPREIAANGRADRRFTVAQSDVNSFVAINRLLKSGESVALPDQPIAGERRFAAASGDASALARTLGVHVAAGGGDASGLLLRRPRIGLFDVYGGNMATGWTRWVLEQFEFDVTPVYTPRVHEGDLARDFDVLIFHTGLPPATRKDQMDRALRRGRNVVDDEVVTKLVEALPPFEDWTDVGLRRERLDPGVAIAALQEFVADGGGALIGLGTQATRIAQHFDLPVDEGVWLTESGKRRRARQSEFFVPGSLVWIDVATEDPVGWGVSPRIAAMFRRSPVFTIRNGAEGATSLAHYASADELLASGWAKGPEHLAGKSAAVRVEYGAGHVFLFGADVVYRGQPLGTMKLLFNAILTATAERVDESR